MRLTTLELKVIEAALRDVDPAHFETYEGDKERRAFDRALAKINREIDRRETTTP